MSATVAALLAVLVPLLLAQGRRVDRFEARVVARFEALTADVGSAPRPARPGGARGPHRRCHERTVASARERHSGAQHGSRRRHERPKSRLRADGAAGRRAAHTARVAPVDGLPAGVSIETIVDTGESGDALMIVAAVTGRSPAPSPRCGASL